MNNTSRLLVDEHPLLVQPSLVMAIGLERALILQQIHFLAGVKGSGLDREGHHWVYNTAEAWHADFFPFWHADTIRKMLKALEKDGLLVSRQFDKNDWNHRKYYRIAYDRLDQELAALDAENSPDDPESNAASPRNPHPDQSGISTRFSSETSAETSPETSEKISPEPPASETAASKTPSQHQLLFAALADLCQLDMRLMAPRIGKAAKELAKAVAATPEQVLAFKAWWYAFDWRGQKGRPPTLAQVAEYWTQAASPTPPTNNAGVTAATEPAGFAAIREAMCDPRYIAAQAAKATNGRHPNGQL